MGFKDDRPSRMDDRMPPPREDRGPMRERRDERPMMRERPMRDERPPMREERLPLREERSMREERPVMRESRPMREERSSYRDERPSYRDERPPLRGNTFAIVSINIFVLFKAAKISWFKVSHRAKAKEIGYQIKHHLCTLTLFIGLNILDKHIPHGLPVVLKKTLLQFHVLTFL
jgi:hypothetical protein